MIEVMPNKRIKQLQRISTDKGCKYSEWDIENGAIKCSITDNYCNNIVYGKLCRVSRVFLRRCTKKNG
jgi:hypothetical protein